MDITLDIETIPNLDAAAIEEIAAGIQAPGNYKKLESIAEWLAENRERIVEETVHKACFAGETGQIICIGWAWEDAPAKVAVGPEAEILRTLFSDIDASGSHAPATVIGHNVNWDIRYIWQRAVVHGIKPPWRIKWQGKPWDHQDTMLLWNPERDRKISLDKLCRILGVPTSKSDLDGSKVWEYFKSGRINEIAEYCRKDVEATRQCHRRMMFNFESAAQPDQAGDSSSSLAPAASQGAPAGAADPSYTILDAIVRLASFTDVEVMGLWADADVPIEIRNDERFAAAFRKRMDDLKASGCKEKK